MARTYDIIVVEVDLGVGQVDVLAEDQAVVVVDLVAVVVDQVVAVQVVVADQVVRKDNSNPVVGNIPSTERYSLVAHLEIETNKILPSHYDCGKMVLKLSSWYVCMVNTISSVASLTIFSPAMQIFRLH